MDIKKILKEALPHLGILIGFVLISVIYFSPVLDGKKMPQMDNIHAEGMAQELVEFEKENPGEESQWTNSMFGGMPAYQIKGGTSYNVFVHIVRFFRFGLPYTTVAVLFTYLFGFYILLLSVNLNKWLSAIGALAFAFASYNLIIIEAGHITKTYAIAYMAPVLAGVLLTYNRKYWLGAFITLLFLGVEIASNHVQITYYLALMIMLLVIVQFVYAILNHQIPHFFKASAILLIVALLAVAPATKNLWTTYEYGKESIRGASDLEQEGEKKSDGLDKDYALAWSYGKAETLTLLIPNVHGGGVERLDTDSETYQAMIEQGLQPQTAKAVAQSTPTYWGKMPFTSGPVYFGTLVVLLFFFGLMAYKGPEKWWLLTVVVLSIFLAWGKNMMWFTDLFFYYFPLYNKFRTVSMILVIANVAFVLLAFLSLKALMDKKRDKKELTNYLAIATATVGGIILLVIVTAKFVFDFNGLNDPMIINQLQSAGFPEQIIAVYQESVHADRLAMLRADAFRSLAFVLISAGVLWLFIQQKIKASYFFAALAFIVLADMWSIDRRYLNNDDFVSKSVARNQFQKTKADEMILKDVDPHYRVLSLTRSVFNDAYTPYFHKSIGGYHGAKLRRYQELIDNQIVDELQKLQRALSRKGATFASLDSTMKQLPALNMLNTKYIIYGPDSYTINMNALGNAWFVDEYEVLENANAEIAAVGKIDPAQKAVADKRFANYLEGLSLQKDTTSNNELIKLATYKPNYLLYQTNTKKEQLAVFSEIYYDKGWQAYLDDKPVEHIRVNYLLRALRIPAGKHKVEFRFEPVSHEIGKNIAGISSMLSIIFMLAMLFLAYRENVGSK